VDYELAIHNFLVLFTSILYEALPFIVLGAIIAGILEELVPQRWVVKVIPRSRVLAIAIGGLLGLLFPMCECGIIPVMRRLLRKGVPLSCCVCYMLAGPIINVVVMMSTFVAFSAAAVNPAGISVQDKPGGAWMMPQHQEVQGRQDVAHISGLAMGLGMMGLRMGLGYAVAIGVSLIVEWQYRKRGSALLSESVTRDAALGAAEDEDNGAAKGPRPSVMQRLGNISETALHDFVDVTVFLILGALLAALARQLLDPHQIAEYSRNYPVLSIGLMMGLAIVLCLCSEADAFVAASFVSIQPAAKLAFLVLGPMLDFKLYMMYTRVFRPRLIWTIIVAVVVQVFLWALLTHFAWEAYLAHQAAAPTPTTEARVK
jgi:uncharacterized membrane protein YraQ (UPF0718 family)